MFGHLSGAFTDANRDRVGRIELADGGTLFLDEIGDMQKSLQVKLLRVLQSGEYYRVGDDSVRHSDFRVVAATHRDLSVAIDQGEFRSDLFYRLNIIRIEIPPLRERVGDVQLLIEHFVKSRSEHHKKPGLSVDQEVIDSLQEHSFPGNIRELQNVVEHCVIVCQDREISTRDLPLYLRNQKRIDRVFTKRFHEAKAETIERFERHFLNSRLREHHGVIAVAARASGLSERNFHAKLKKYGISARDIGPADE